MKRDTRTPLYVIAFTAALSVVFTAAIMTLQATTADIIARNKQARLKAEIVRLFGFPEATGKTTAQLGLLYDRRVDETLKIRDPETGAEMTVLRAYRADAKPDEQRRQAECVALAFPISGVGFWDRIGGWMAVTPDRARVLGVVFLEQKETPGLGGRIEEDAFRDKFAGLDITPPTIEGAQFIYIGKGSPPGADDPRGGRFVEAITGATQTSLALQRFINANLATFSRAMTAQALVEAN